MVKKFRQWLEDRGFDLDQFIYGEPDQDELRSVDPNTLYEPGSVVFIYPFPSGPLLTAKYPVTHEQMMADAKIANLVGAKTPDRLELMKHALIGRIGRSKSGEVVIGIWNSSDQAVEGLLQAAAAKKLIDKNSVISGGTISPTRVKDYQGQVSPQRYTQDQMTAPHLMTGDAKKAALGITGTPGFGSGKKKTWPGLYPPWRATSEGNNE